MPIMRPDPTFYPSPKMAMDAPAERLAYTVLINPEQKGRPDAIGVVDVDPGSDTCGRLVGETEMLVAGDELHHFGWNACSACLSPYAPHAHLRRRYLIVPGIRSSRIYILDTAEDPKHPRIVKVIEPEELAERAGYSRPHTVHCGPFGIYVNALGAPSGDGPGGVFMIDHEDFDVLGRWELDRGPQELAYDFWWHLGFDTMITSEWGTPNMIEGGLDPELLLHNKYGHQLHFWDLQRRRHLQTVDLGAENQIVLELRPAHDPTRAYGFAGVAISTRDLSASIFTWYQKNGRWEAVKTIEIPAEPARADDLPPLLKGFEAVPPLVTDINLSLDDRYLYVSCFGTGELQQYDVSDPFHPEKIGSFRLGGVTARAAHPGDSETPLTGAPQMVELSRDGRRLYVTNSLYLAWDRQLYPDGIRGWMAKARMEPGRPMELDQSFFVEFGDMRAHQVRLEGGDASSDSYCYP